MDASRCGSGNRPASQKQLDPVPIPFTNGCLVQPFFFLTLEFYETVTVGSRLECSIQEKLPFFIWGAAGIGKSDLIKLVAEKRGLSLCDLRVALYDPVDLRGLPRFEEDKTVWQAPAVLPRDGKGILFLDDLTTAPQMIQACYQLVLDRKLGEYTLPDGWVVVAAGNPASERGVHFAISC
jgi:MoxR-like ATPase